MSDNKVGTYKFVAEPFHCDFTGKLTMSVLGNHLLNCAGFHAADRGFGIATLNENHYTWVLSRLAVELEEMPREYESFSIQTWVENVYRLFTDRNFAILDKEGNAVGYARSVWAMISMETRKPADLLTLHGGSITDYVCDKDCPISKPGRIKVTEKTPLVEYRTKYSDIDINGHVNSIKYIEHILDLFPIEVFKEKQVKRFEMAYVAESYYGDVLSFYREEVRENEYDIEVKKNGAEVVVRSKVIFTETVVIRDEFPLEKAREVLKDETIAVIGYGVQGPGQSLNLRDNGFNVIVGQRPGKTYEKAVADGWVPGETLFGIEEACQKASIIMCLLSDAAVMSVWPTIKPCLTPGKALYFSHGFAITWSDRTGVVPPTDVDVIMVAPKGSGTSLRTMFLEGRGLNSSYAIYQDVTGKAYERTIALGIGIGSGYLFETTFQREATSDLTGERGSLMGAIQGLLLAQYEVLRENGHTPSEAFNETVEELTQSLMPLFAKNGMDWMYANCSTTAQRGALDWMTPFHDAIKPVVEKLYHSVKTGNEAQISIDSNSKPDYREKLEEELKALRESEMWQTAVTVRKLRPENN